MKLVVIVVAAALVLGAVACGGGSSDGDGDGGGAVETPGSATPALRTVSSQLDGGTAVELQVTSEWFVDAAQSSLVIAERSEDLDPAIPPSGARLLVGVSVDGIDAALALLPAGTSETEAAARFEVVAGPDEGRTGAGSGYDSLSITTEESSGTTTVTRRYLTVFHDSTAHLLVLEAPSTNWEAAIRRLDALVADSLRFGGSATVGTPGTDATATPEPASPAPSEIPSGWTLDLLETFDRPVRWFEGERDGDPPAGAEFVDGMYRVTVSGDRGLGARELIAIRVDPELAISVDATRVTAEAFCGLTLNYESGWRVDYVVNMTTQRVGVVALRGSDFVQLVEGREEPLVRTDGANRFTVIAEGARIATFLNGALLGETENDRFGPVEHVGVLVGNQIDGPSATCAFDDFAIYVP